MPEKVRAKLGSILLCLTIAGVWVLALMLAMNADDVARSGELLTFASEDELQDFVESSRDGALDEYYESAPRTDIGTSEEAASPTYSTTNVQVAGVDEADIVKTNGEQIFLASYQQVAILQAGDDGGLSPLSVIDKEALSALLPEGTYFSVSGMYVLDGRLTIIISGYGQVYDGTIEEEGLDMWPVFLSRPASYIVTVDITDPAHPDDLSVTGISGWLQTSRLVEGTVYVVATDAIWYSDGEIPLPAVWNDGGLEEADAGDIMYDPDMCFADSYINILSYDVHTEEFEASSILSAWASTVYMTTENLYLTYQKWVGEILRVDEGMSPEDTDSARTTIYKLAVDGLSLEPVAVGEVDGWLLNQFSMDESSGFLRVAATTSWSSPENAVYVLDESLVQVGGITGLAPSESLFAARFVGDTAYLVTFLQIDPLFVVDLSDPYSPELLGELKVPGFSTYLHPIGDGLLIGVGSEDSSAKVSIFDVSDPSVPLEVDTAFLGEGIVPEGYSEYAYSEAQWDHKAFMYDPERRLLVLPLSISGWNLTETDDGYYTYTYDYFSWNGFCGLRVSADGQLEELGLIEHPDYSKRALYIGDVLYTVSESTIKSSSIEGLAFISSFVYNDQYPYYDETVTDQAVDR